MSIFVRVQEVTHSPGEQCERAKQDFEQLSPVRSVGQRTVESFAFPKECMRESWTAEELHTECRVVQHGKIGLVVGVQLASGRN